MPSRCSRTYHHCFAEWCAAASSAALPAFMRRRFLTVTKDEDAWKGYVGLQDDKDAYLILLDTEGRVQWSRHGQFDQAVYDSLKATITQMLSHKAT